MAAPCAHLTSSAKICSSGLVSTSARRESSKFLLVCCASDFCASGRTITLPLNTAFAAAVALDERRPAPSSAYGQNPRMRHDLALPSRRYEHELDRPIELDSVRERDQRAVVEKCGRERREPVAVEAGVACQVALGD